jgi:hypothetical protein
MGYTQKDWHFVSMSRAYQIWTTFCDDCGLVGPWRVFRIGTPMADDVLMDCGANGHVISEGMAVEAHGRPEDWDKGLSTAKVIVDNQ